MCEKTKERQTEFYMVFVEGGQSPKVKHATQEQASTEAYRLAKDTGKTVYVLIAGHGYSVPEPLRFTCTAF